MGGDDANFSRGSVRQSNGSRLNVSITPTPPSSVDTGQLFTIKAQTKFSSDSDGNNETVTVTCTFTVDDEQIDQFTFELAEGNAKTRSKEYALTTTGAHSVSVSVSATIDGNTRTDDGSHSIDASSAGPPLDKTRGAGFAVPDSMKDEVEDYRNEFYVDLPYAFVLALPDKVHLVFCNNEPTPSEAEVSGPVLYSSQNVNGITFEVVAATKTKFITTGDTATVADVEESPSDYAFKLVRIDDHHERIATLYDPDNGDDVTVSSTLGRLKETDSSSVFVDPGVKARELTTEVRKDTGDLRSKLQSFLQNDSPSLTTLNFATNYWSASDSVVDALVLTSGSTARDFLASFDKPGITAESNGEPLLYVVQTGFDTTTYSSVSDLKAGDNDGELVEITADAQLLRVSAQEVLEHATEACGNERIKTQNAGCVNLLQDVLFETGVCWTSLPDSKDDLLFVAGMSSDHLDQPYEAVDGTYTLRGEIISTTRFDSSLPAGKLLVIYERSYRDPIDYESYSAEVRERIEEQQNLLSGGVQHQLQDIANQATQTWSFDTGHRIQHSHVTLSESRVYLGGLGRTVYALEDETGNIDWTFDREGSLVDSAPAVDTDTVVIGGGDGRLYGIDSVSGAEEWTFSTESAIVSSPTVVSGTAYVGNNSGTVYAVDCDRETDKWAREVGSAVLSDPVVDAGTVYITTEDGTVAALDAGTGDSVWSITLNEVFDARSPTVHNSGRYLNDDLVFVAGDSLYAILQGSGSISWQINPDGQITTAPVVWNGRVYIGTAAGDIHAFDANTGAEAWVTSVGAGDRTTVDVDSKLTVATNSGTVHLLDAYLGTTLESVDVGGGIYASPLRRDGSLYVMGGKRLIVVDFQ